MPSDQSRAEPDPAGRLTAALDRGGGDLARQPPASSPDCARCSARNLASRPVRAALTAAAVALGVAVILGVQIEVAGVNAQAGAAARLRAGGSGLDVRASSGAGLSQQQLTAAGRHRGGSRGRPPLPEAGHRPGHRAPRRRRSR